MGCPNGFLENQDQTSSALAARQAWLFPVSGAAAWLLLSHFAFARHLYIRTIEFKSGLRDAREGVTLMTDCKNRVAGCGRRRALKLLGSAVAMTGLSALVSDVAQAKTSQAAANYRGSPKGRQSCANCSWFEPPSGCGVVRGPVSARGWCNLWG